MLRARRFSLVALFALLLVALCGGCVLPPGGSVPTQDVAPTAAPVESGFSLCGCVLSEAVASRNADLDRAASMGATWVRLDMNWATLEMHGKGNYNWAPGDDLVRAATSRGLKVDAEVSYTPSWARPAGTSSTTPPTRLADYSDFMGAAARHYAPLGVHTWEIWNEPNMTQMWSPRPDVAKYTQMLKLAYPAIKSADSHATVVTGGLSPAYDAPDHSQVLPLTFVEGMYANGAHGSFDALALHPSSYPSPSTLIAPWNPFQQSKDLYASMSAHGDAAKKIWATEITFPTGTNAKAVSETAQGTLLAGSYAAWRQFPFHGPMFVYSLRDTGTNAADLYSTNGVYHYDGSPKASVPAVKEAFRIAEAS